MEQLKEQYDVTIEKQQYQDLSYQGTRLRLFAETGEMDLPTVTEGRNIEAEDEILLTYRYAKANGIAMAVSGQKYRKVEMTESLKSMSE